MNELGTKQRRANWPGVEASLRAHDYVYLTPKDKPAMRKYYIEGIEPKLFCGEVGLLARLMCEPQATRAKWKCWKQEAGERGGLWRSFMTLQANTDVYMNGNSPFGGREEEIYDYFFSDLFKPYKRQLTEEDIYAYTESLRSFVKSIGGISLATHSQVCGEVDRLVQGVPEQPTARFLSEREEALRSFVESIGDISLATHSQVRGEFDRLVAEIAEQPTARYRREDEKANDSQTYAKVFCPIAWAFQHPDKFDQKLKVPIQTLYNFLTNPKVSPLLRDTFNTIVENNLERYAENTGAGGRVSACFQFRSKAQLQAVLPLLSPSTRYPYSADTPRDKVVGLPRWTQERINRTSYRAIRYLWKSGFIADRVSVLDDRTFFVQFRAPLGRCCLEDSLHALRQDLTDLEARITSVKTLPKDDRKRNQYARCVFVVEPLLGRLSVGASMSKGGVEFVQVINGTDRVLDKYFKRNSALEEVLPELLASEYERIREKGTSSYLDWGYF